MSALRIRVINGLNLTMLRSAAATFLTLISAVMTPAAADPIDGYDDPQLQAALAEWLNADNPIDTYEEIGRLARDGNLAARFFANQVYYDPGWFHPDRELSRDERAALFPRLPDDTRPRSFQPYQIDDDAAPGMAARRAIGPTVDRDEWIELAEVMLAAGLRESVLVQTAVVPSNGPHLNIEAMQFSAEIISPADQRSFDIWAFLLFEEKRAEHLPDETRSARWFTSPTDLLSQTGYHEALEGGVWSAVRAAASIMMLDPDPAASTEPEVAAMTRLLQARWDGEAGAQADLDRIGALVLSNREQSPYLRPILRICESACADVLRACAANGAINDFDARFGARTLEPLVDAETYFMSRRAEDEVLATIAARTRSATVPLLTLPQCLADALP
ncbi:hypothetical protein HKCCE4037_18805 [Rhodobacterales bacterium HKCCE4037]|nr:hypothetical protein [Rhodobacterales bacterium HKCCE4037]